MRIALVLIMVMIAQNVLAVLIGIQVGKFLEKKSRNNNVTREI